MLSYRPAWVFCLISVLRGFVLDFVSFGSVSVDSQLGHHRWRWAFTRHRYFVEWGCENSFPIITKTMNDLFMAELQRKAMLPAGEILRGNVPQPQGFLRSIIPHHIVAIYQEYRMNEVMLPSSFRGDSFLCRRYRAAAYHNGKTIKVHF